LKEAFETEDFTFHTPNNTASFSNIGSYGVEPAQEMAVPVAILYDGQVHMNVSQIQTYLDCPLEFYYRHILCVPQEPSPNMQYGSIMHSMAETINRGIMNGNIPNLSDLKEQLEAQWPRAGYLSPGHRDRAFKQALATMANLHERMTGDRRMPVAVEEPFAFTLEDSALSVSGRFDAVFPLGDSVEIVDYKTTTSVDSPEKAKARASASQQLTLYAMAWQLLHDQMPALVTLDFIDTGQIGSLKKTQRGIDGAYKRLHEVAEGIRNGDFRPGKDHTFCSHPPV
jgi:RecB family exonuclease